MLLKCKQCGYENQIGSIFCRGCGAKVDSSALDPNSPEASQAQAAERKKKAVRTFLVLLKNTVVLLILAFLVATICFMFTTSHAPAYSAPAEIDAAKLTKRIEHRRNIALSPEAMTVLFKEHVMKNITDSKGSYVPTDVIFQCDDTAKDVLKIYIHTKIIGVKAVCTLRGKLSRSNDGKILFNMLSIQLGKVNIPYGEEMLLEKFDPVLKCRTIQNLFRDASNVNFSEGQLHIQYNR